MVPAPADNGGATSRGVTATTIKVAIVVPNAQQLAAVAGAQRVNPATGQPIRVQDVVTDVWAAFSHTYETWGRKVEFSFVTSSGDDEAAQRADAVTIEQLKPFAVIDTFSGGLARSPACSPRTSTWCTTTAPRPRTRSTRRRTAGRTTTRPARR